MTRFPQVKSTALVLAVLFFLNDVAYAAPALDFSAAMRRETPKILFLDIPSDLASLEEWYQGSDADGSRLVFHIQDAHAQPEAQARTRDLIRYLHDRYGVKTVFVEGAAEKLDAKFLYPFADQDKNKKWAEEKTASGEMSGIDLALLEGVAVEALPIETIEGYRGGYEKLRSVYSKERVVSEFFEFFNARIEAEATQVLNDPTREILKEWQKFESGHREFLPFVKKLAERAESELDLNFKKVYTQIEWPHMTRLLALQEVEKELDARNASGARLREQALADKQAILDLLKLKNAAGSVVQALERLEEKNLNLNRITLEDGRVHSTPRAMVELLFEECRKLEVNLRAYPAFLKYAGYVILRGELNASSLFLEIEKLFDRLLGSGGTSVQAAMLVDLYRDSFLLKKLLNLELSRDEWKRAVQKRKELEPSKILEQLKSFQAARQVPQAVNGDRAEPRALSPLMATFNSAFSFYDAAIAREKIFFKKMTEGFNEDGRAILISGGFHTEGLNEFFRENEISYGTLTPRISKTEPVSFYRQAMLAEMATQALVPLATSPATRAAMLGRAQSKRSEARSAFIQKIMSLYGQGLQALPELLQVARATGDSRQLSEQAQVLALAHTLFTQAMNRARESGDLREMKILDAHADEFMTLLLEHLKASEDFFKAEVPVTEMLVEAGLESRTEFQREVMAYLREHFGQTEQEISEDLVRLSEELAAQKFEQVLEAVGQLTDSANQLGLSFGERMHSRLVDYLMDEFKQDPEGGAGLVRSETRAAVEDVQVDVPDSENLTRLLKNLTPFTKSQTKKTWYYIMIPEWLGWVEGLVLEAGEQGVTILPVSSRDGKLLKISFAQINYGNRMGVHLARLGFEQELSPQQALPAARELVRQYLKSTEPPDLAEEIAAALPKVETSLRSTWGGRSEARLFTVREFLKTAVLGAAAIGVGAADVFAGNNRAGRLANLGGEAYNRDGWIVRDEDGKLFLSREERTATGISVPQIMELDLQRGALYFSLPGTEGGKKGRWAQTFGFGSLLLPTFWSHNEEVEKLHPPLRVARIDKISNAPNAGVEIIGGLISDDGLMEADFQLRVSRFKRKRGAAQYQISLKYDIRVSKKAEKGFRFPRQRVETEALKLFSIAGTMEGAKLEYVTPGNQAVEKDLEAEKKGRVGTLLSVPSVQVKEATLSWRPDPTQSPLSVRFTLESARLPVLQAVNVFFDPNGQRFDFWTGALGIKEEYQPGETVFSGEVALEVQPGEEQSTAIEEDSDSRQVQPAGGIVPAQFSLRDRKSRSETRLTAALALEALQAYANWLSQADYDLSSKAALEKLKTLAEQRSVGAFLLLGNPDAKTFIEFAKRWHALNEMVDREIPVVIAGGVGRGTIGLIESTIAHYSKLRKLTPVEEELLRDARGQVELYRQIVDRAGSDGQPVLPPTITEKNVILFILSKEIGRIQFKDGYRNKLKNLSDYRPENMTAPLIRFEKGDSKNTAQNFEFSIPVINDLKARSGPFVEGAEIVVVTEPSLLARLRPTYRNALKKINQEEGRWATARVYNLDLKQILNSQKITPETLTAFLDKALYWAGPSAWMKDNLFKDGKFPSLGELKGYADQHLELLGLEKAETNFSEVPDYQTAASLRDAALKTADALIDALIADGYTIDFDKANRRFVVRRSESREGFTEVGTVRLPMKLADGLVRERLFRVWKQDHSEKKDERIVLEELGLFGGDMDLMAYAHNGRLRGVYIDERYRGRNMLRPLLNTFFTVFPHVSETSPRMNNLAVIRLLTRDYGFRPVQVPHATVWLGPRSPGSELYSLYFESMDDQYQFLADAPAGLSSLYRIVDSKTGDFIPVPFRVGLSPRAEEETFRNALRNPDVAWVPRTESEAGKKFKRALIIHSEKSFQQILSVVLKRRGMSAEAFQSIQAGLGRLAEQNDFDSVILDAEALYGARPEFLEIVSRFPTLILGDGSESEAEWSKLLEGRKYPPHVTLDVPLRSLNDFDSALRHLEGEVARSEVRGSGFWAAVGRGIETFVNRHPIISAILPIPFIYELSSSVPGAAVGNVLFYVTAASVAVFLVHRFGGRSEARQGKFSGNIPAAFWVLAIEWGALAAVVAFWAPSALILIPLILAFSVVSPIYLRWRGTRWAAKMRQLSSSERNVFFESWAPLHSPILTLSDDEQLARKIGEAVDLWSRDISRDLTIPTDDGASFIFRHQKVRGRHQILVFNDKASRIDSWGIENARIDFMFSSGKPEENLPARVTNATKRATDLWIEPRIRELYRGIDSALVGLVERLGHKWDAHEIFINNVDSTGNPDKDAGTFYKKIGFKNVTMEFGGKALIEQPDQYIKTIDPVHFTPIVIVRNRSEARADLKEFFEQFPVQATDLVGHQNDAFSVALFGLLPVEQQKELRLAESAMALKWNGKSLMVRISETEKDGPALGFNSAESIISKHGWFEFGGRRIRFNSEWLEEFRFDPDQNRLIARVQIPAGQPNPFVELNEAELSTPVAAGKLGWEIKIETTPGQIVSFPGGRSEMRFENFIEVALVSAATALVVSAVVLAWQHRARLARLLRFWRGTASEETIFFDKSNDPKNLLADAEKVLGIDQKGGGWARSPDYEVVGKAIRDHHELLSRFPAGQELIKASPEALTIAWNLHTILWEILKNAKDAYMRGYRKGDFKDGLIYFEIFRRNGALIFEISDDGVGFAQIVDASGKFDPQANPSPVDTTGMLLGGQHLGLFLARTLVKAYGGELKILSPGLNGHSSTVRIILPQHAITGVSLRSEMRVEFDGKMKFGSDVAVEFIKRIESTLGFIPKGGVLRLAAGSEPSLKRVGDELVFTTNKTELNPALDQFSNFLRKLDFAQMPWKQPGAGVTRRQVVIAIASGSVGIAAFLAFRFFSLSSQRAEKWRKLANDIRREHYGQFQIAERSIISAKGEWQGRYRILVSGAHTSTQATEGLLQHVDEFYSDPEKWVFFIEPLNPENSEFPPYPEEAVAVGIAKELQIPYLNVVPEPSDPAVLVELERRKGWTRLELAASYIVRDLMGYIDMRREVSGAELDEKTDIEFKTISNWFQVDRGQLQAFVLNQMKSLRNPETLREYTARFFTYQPEIVDAVNAVAKTRLNEALARYPGRKYLFMSGGLHAEVAGGMSAQDFFKMKGFDASAVHSPEAILQIAGYFESWEKSRRSRSEARVLTQAELMRTSDYNPENYILDSLPPVVDAAKAIFSDIFPAHRLATARHLDVATGRGLLVKEALQAGVRDIVALDHSEGMLRNAREQVQTFQQTQKIPGQVQWINSDFRGVRDALKQKNVAGSFDLITMANVVEFYTPDELRIVFEQLKEVLAQDGMIVFQLRTRDAMADDNYPSYRDIPHDEATVKRVYKPYQDLLRQVGFETELIHVSNEFDHDWGDERGDLEVMVNQNYLLKAVKRSEMRVIEMDVSQVGEQDLAAALLQKVNTEIENKSEKVMLRVRAPWGSDIYQKLRSMAFAEAVPLSKEQVAAEKRKLALALIQKDPKKIQYELVYKLNGKDQDGRVYYSDTFKKFHSEGVGKGADILRAAYEQGKIRVTDLRALPLVEMRLRDVGAVKIFAETAEVDSELLADEAIYLSQSARVLDPVAAEQPTVDFARESDASMQYRGLLRNLAETLKELSKPESAWSSVAPDFESASPYYQKLIEHPENKVSSSDRLIAEKEVRRQFHELTAFLNQRISQRRELGSKDIQLVMSKINALQRVLRAQLTSLDHILFLFTNEARPEVVAQLGFSGQLNPVALGEAQRQAMLIQGETARMLPHLHAVIRRALAFENFWKLAVPQLMMATYASSDDSERVEAKQAAEKLAGSKAIIQYAASDAAVSDQATMDALADIAGEIASLVNRIVENYGADYPLSAESLAKAYYAEGIRLAQLEDTLRTASVPYAILPVSQRFENLGTVMAYDLFFHGLEKGGKRRPDYMKEVAQILNLAQEFFDKAGLNSPNGPPMSAEKLLLGDSSLKDALPRGSKRSEARQLEKIIKDKVTKNRPISFIDLDTGKGVFVPVFKKLLEGWGYQVGRALGTEPLQSVIAQASAAAKPLVVHANAQIAEEFAQFEKHSFDIVTINNIESAPWALAERAHELLVKKDGLLLVTLEAGDVADGRETGIIDSIKNAGFDIQVIDLPTDYPSYSTLFKSSRLVIASLTVRSEMRPQIPEALEVVRFSDVDRIVWDNLTAEQIVVVIARGFARPDLGTEDKVNLLLSVFSSIKISKAEQAAKTLRETAPEIAALVKKPGRVFEVLTTEEAHNGFSDETLDAMKLIWLLNPDQEFHFYAQGAEEVHGRLHAGVEALTAWGREQNLKLDGKINLVVREMPVALPRLRAQDVVTGASAEVLQPFANSGARLVESRYSAQNRKTALMVLALLSMDASALLLAQIDVLGAGKYALNDKNLAQITFAERLNELFSQVAIISAAA